MQLALLAEQFPALSGTINDYQDPERVLGPSLLRKWKISGEL
jgi:hypothetical protein